MGLWISNFIPKMIKQVIEQHYSKDSRPEVFYKKGVLKNFTKFTDKHLCQSLLLEINLCSNPLHHGHFIENERV